jgi:hypothetical protein
MFIKKNRHFALLGHSCKFLVPVDIRLQMSNRQMISRDTADKASI